jgi:hypothetical protein
MTTRTAQSASEPTTRTLVWIDAREALLVRWDGTEPHLARLESDVPSRHRSTGHFSYEPPLRQRGVSAADAGEYRRLEHVRRWLAEVAGHIAPEDDVEVIGPGPMHEQLARLIAEEDRAHVRTRSVERHASRRLTDPQLMARLRQGAGAAPRRGRAEPTGAAHRRTARVPRPRHADDPLEQVE